MHYNDASSEQDRLAALHRFELLDTPPEPAFDQITRLAAKLLDVPIALVSLIDAERQWFKSRVGWATADAPRNVTFCNHTIRQNKVMVVEDARADPRFSKNPLVTGEESLRFYAGVPLRTNEGHAIGTLCVLDRMARPTLTHAEEETLWDLSALVMAHIESRQAVGYLAPVTGLPNRFRLLKDLDASMADPAARQVEFALMAIDAASSQLYSDLIRTLGHAYADEFESAAAQRIRSALPDRTRLYHLSAVRFGCVLPISAPVTEIAECVLTALRDPIICSEIPIGTSAGVGIAQYPPDGADSVGLLRAATSAAHSAIEFELGWRRFSLESDDTSRRRFRLLGDIGSALTEPGQLSLVYQPKLDLLSNRCVGAEALLRWRHPTLGMISPDEFVPLIERTARMRSLTDWVLDACLAQIAAWRRCDLMVPISINVSVRDLEQPDCARRIAEKMKRHGVSPEWIDIEVTESGLMHNRDVVIEQLAGIRALGIRLAIDDFGTGHSALSYLKYIPADTLKIDQMFVRALLVDNTDRHLVRSTIELAHQLGHKVVAEGIETKEVQNWLRDNRCDIGQGFQIARPLDAKAFEAWLSQRAI